MEVFLSFGLYGEMKDGGLLVISGSAAWSESGASVNSKNLTSVKISPFYGETQINSLFYL